MDEKIKHNLNITIEKINILIDKIMNQYVKKHFDDLSILITNFKTTLIKIRNIIYKIIHNYKNLLPNILNETEKYTLSIINIVKKLCNKDMFTNIPKEYSYEEICTNILDSFNILYKDIKFLHRLSLIPLGHTFSINRNSDVVNSN